MYLGKDLLLMAKDKTHLLAPVVEALPLDLVGFAALMDLHWKR